MSISAYYSGLISLAWISKWLGFYSVWGHLRIWRNEYSAYSVPPYVTSYQLQGGARDLFYLRPPQICPYRSFGFQSWHPSLLQNATWAMEFLCNKICSFVLPQHGSVGKTKKEESCLCTSKIIATWQQLLQASITVLTKPFHLETVLKVIVVFLTVCPYDMCCSPHSFCFVTNVVFYKFTTNLVRDSPHASQRKKNLQDFQKQILETRLSLLLFLPLYKVRAGPQGVASMAASQHACYFNTRHIMSLLRSDTPG